MIKFHDRAKGITVVSIENSSASAEISLYGGHVLSFKPTGQKDLLFVSKHSCFETGKPIRGGIPVCWPWFGPHPDNSTLPMHGFARLSQWRLVSTQEDSNNTTIEIETVSTPQTLAMWPHEFKLNLQIFVGKELSLKLTTANTGSQEFCVTDGLHSYFNIGAIDSVFVTGLENSNYLDRIGEKTVRLQTGNVVIAGETDRVYQSESVCTIVDPIQKRKIDIAKSGFLDTIVWNPWIDRSKAIVDFGDNEYQNMICVESGSVLENVFTVASGKSVTQTMILSVDKLL